MHTYAKNTDGSQLKVGIVQACFTEEIGCQLLEACVDELGKLGVAPENIKLAKVPGALEVPLTLQAFAKTGHFDALVALGVVIRGETYHFELVANESGAGVSKVALDYNIPIANAILTTEDDDQALCRTQVKGREAAVVAVQMANLLKDITKG
jgi:6,7-dimethyl-8-ribityllumazine synthase